MRVLTVPTGGFASRADAVAACIVDAKKNGLTGRIACHQFGCAMEHGRPCDCVIDMVFVDSQGGA